MAENTRAIKSKISSTANLRKITRAMEMVARSKMKRAVDTAVGARPYTEKGLELLVELSGDESKSKHPLLKEGEGERVLIVHIASDKGLCGGYNAQALRKLESFVAANKEAEIHAVTIGRHALHHAEKVGILPIEAFDFGENPTLEEAEKVATYIRERFLGGTYGKALISYTNFETVFSQTPLVRQVLPITKESLVEMIELAGSEEDRKEVGATQQERFVEYKFEPSRDRVLEIILPHLVSVQIFQSLLEAQASEQSARMVAMKNATDNATKLGEELTLRYNRARQAGITNEIIEIAAGADAV